MGAVFPPGYSAAEFALQALSTSLAAEFAPRPEEKTRVRPGPSVARVSGPAEEAVDYGTRAPWWVEYLAISGRTLRIRSRQRLQTRLNVINTLVISAIAGSVYWQLDSNQASIRARTGAVFFLFVHPVFSAIFE